MEAINSFAPKLSGVLGESSRTVSLPFGLFNDSFEIREHAKQVGRVAVVVVKPHQNKNKKRDVWTSNLECVCTVVLDVPPRDLGYEGQCGVMRRNLSRKRIKVSSGSKWTYMITKISAQTVCSQYGHGLGK